MFYKIRMSLTAIIVISSLLQLMMFPTLENIVCVSIAAVTSIVTIHVMLRRNIFQLYTITSLMVLIFTLSNLALPIVATTAELNPLIFNLSVPVQTFFYIALVSIILLISHSIYRALPIANEIRRLTTTRVHTRLGLFAKPSDTQLWVMGFIGMFATAYVWIFLPEAAALDGGEGGGPGSKLLQALANFAYAPMLIPLSFLYAERRRLNKTQTVCLVLYFLAILVLAVLRNNRGTFALLVFTLLMSVIVGLLTFRLPLKAINPRKVLIGLVLAGLGLSTLSRLATAMVIARVEGYEKKTSEVASDSFKIFLDPQRIDDFQRARLTVGNESWNEYYVTNAFLSRFISVKFHDNILNLVNQQDVSDQADLRRVTIEKTWAILPGPILSFLSVSVDKEALTRSSVGDYIWYFHSGRGLAGKRVGSFIGNGIAILGPWFFIVVIPFYLAIFPFMDSLAYHKRSIFWERLSNGKLEKKSYFLAKPQFSVVFLINFSTIVFYLSMESLSGYAEFFMRYFPQMIILYSVMFFATSFLRTRKASSNQEAPA